MRNVTRLLLLLFTEVTIILSHDVTKLFYLRQHCFYE